MRRFFTHWPVPDRLPPNIQKEAEELMKAKDQHDALFQAYDIVTRRFQARHWKTYLYFWRFFDRNLGRIWRNGGLFRQCTHLNWLVKVLAVGSGWFTETDITEHWTMQKNVYPHQYLRVRFTDGSHISVDPWGRTYGIAFGDHAARFKAANFPVWEERP